MTRPPARTCAALLLLVLLMTSTARGQVLDLNGNGVSDVWELIYGVDGVDLSLDSDGDGVPNWLEALAGTDPFDARSVPKIATCEVTPSGVRITASSILGKLYRLQSSEAYTDVTSWQAEDMVVARTNGTVILWAPADRPARFFRLAVADVDTDGDGLSDWEEYQLGLDPLVATSNGQVDAVGRPLTDLQYIRRRLSNTTLASLLAGSGGGMVRRTRGAAISASPPLAPIAAASLPSGTGLTGQYYTNSSSTYSNPINFNPTNLFLTTNDPVIDYRWGPALPINLSNAWCTVRWTGQIEPQYSETYVFETRTDDGVKLWVNDQLLIDQWRLQGSTSWTNAISLQAGVRYNIRIDYFNGGGGARASLYWYSASQPRQIVPGLRLYPSSDGYVPGAVTSPLKAFAFLGQPFLYALTGANTPIGFGATNLPPGLGLNSTNGIISGIPTLAGSYAVGLSVTNAVGDSSALLDLEVFDTGSAVTREVWLGVPGTSVTNI
ncbi:MAG TPA: PA14 domain-containing protein, partial [Candidatus Saccharimonadales bacterium]|nr:PA14 domain-containing protein [Candidatus Saccharimonadales bacterium]